MPAGHHAGMLDTALQTPRPAALPAAANVPHTPALDVLWARHADELHDAQRLRWQVFVGEMGARLNPPRGTPTGLDADLFDPHCEHLLVRTRATADAPPQVVGTYRVLTPAAARLLGGLYSDTEFDLLRLAPLRPRLLELGRSCVHPAWRQGGVILMLWSALIAFMRDNGLDAAIGCASVPMHDGGHAAASLWQALSATHLAPIEHRVTPRLPLPVHELNRTLQVEPPALVKGYLRCGARLLGAPAWDPDFGVADLPLMLRLADLPPAYARRFSPRRC